MGVRDSRMQVALALLVGASVLASCGSATAPPDGAAPLPPQTVVAPTTASGDEAPFQTPSEPAAPPVPAWPEEASRPDPDPSAPLDPARERGKTLIVIDTAEDSGPGEDQDLAAAARRERERRRATEAPVAVIDQKNLSTWAKGGVLTQAAETAEPTPAETAATEAVEKAKIEEAYWRRRGREIRQRWRDAYDQIPVLEAKAEELRTRFYSMDNGYLRDSQVKPEWDKAIADLEEARYSASRGAAEVITFLEEGHRAGALPGWLREGVELEPEPVIETASETDATTLQAGEPVIYGEPLAEGDANAPPPGAPNDPDRRR